MEEEEEEGEEGESQSTEDKIKLEQAKLEEDKKSLQDNHTMMAEVCIHHALIYFSFTCEHVACFYGETVCSAKIIKRIINTIASIWRENI